MGKIIKGNAVLNGLLMIVLIVALIFNGNLAVVAEDLTEVETEDTQEDDDAFVFEAEYCDFESRDEDWQGGGISGGGSYYLDCLIKSANASNKYYLCYTHKTNCWIDFEIESDQECDAQLIVCLGNELGTSIDLTPDVFDISVNETSLEYDTITVPFERPTNFNDYVVSETIHLNEGSNMITLTVLKNQLLNGYATGGPMIDCIKIIPEGDATLTHANFVDNLALL